MAGVSMTHRTRNRIAEHAPHGWYRSAQSAAVIAGMVLCECPCGWLGWIEANKAPRAPEGAR